MTADSDQSIGDASGVHCWIVKAAVTETSSVEDKEHSQTLSANCRST